MAILNLNIYGKIFDQQMCLSVFHNQFMAVSVEGLLSESSPPIKWIQVSVHFLELRENLYSSR